MPELGLEAPMPLPAALRATDDRSSMTLAAFLLAAGAWHQGEAIENSILPEDDLEQLGMLELWRARPVVGERFDPSSDEFRRYFDVEAEPAATPEEYFNQLRELVALASESRSPRDIARAVAKGTTSPDDLLYLCALLSAWDMFGFTLDHRQVFRRFFAWLDDLFYRPSETTGALAAILLQRVLGITVGSAGPSPVSPPAPPVGPGADLMLIHGTNFPPHRPIWSVPGSGPLFKHIAGFRKGIYRAPDYYRWEGGYSDYAREVASLNLRDWVNLRRLRDIDAVTHSHGGNVLMAATQLSVNFRKVVFLSCPVRWNQYRPASSSIAQPHSVRIRFDFVILADRASQRFPNNSNIPETILPLWFVRHGSTTEPTVWANQKLDALLL